MTVKLSDRNGNETVLHLSMQTIMGIVVTLTVAVLSGIIVWVNGLSAQVSAHEAKIAVMGQIDADHKASLDEMKVDIKEMKPLLYDIRRSQQKRGY